MIKAVIFDMDGVIVDSEPLNDQHKALFLKELGIETAGQDVWQQFHGMNSRDAWSKLKTDYGISHDLEYLIERGQASYIDFLNALSEIPIVPGVGRLIKELKKSGHRLAVGSSASPGRVDLVLKKLDLMKYFEVVVHGNEVKHGKPDPELFLLAASKLKMKPAECLVIEDAEAGVKAANAANMKCIGFSGLPHNHEDLSAADLIVTSFNELADTVKIKGQLRI